jgi:hypothetical protein
MDTTPQRVLVHQLKRAIDLIPRDRLAVTRVRMMIEANPRSSRSTHVIRNIGKERARILREIAGEPPARARGALPQDTEADS